MDRFDLQDRVIVITGAGGLLGIKHAEAVAEKGGVPVLLDINIEKASEEALRISAAYKVDVPVYKCDITSEENIKDINSTIMSSYSYVYGLINNAANNPKMDDSTGDNASRLENYKIETWNKDIEVGVTGALLCSRVFGKEMAKHNKGVIVNVSSDLGIIAPDQRLYYKDDINDDAQNVKPVSYSVTKHALIGLTKYLSTYWANKGVRTNSLCPGGVYNGQPNELVERISYRVPMERMARVDEYMGAIQFLCSDASSYMNGACLIIDGGRVIW